MRIMIMAAAAAILALTYDLTSLHPPNPGFMTF